MSISEQFRYRNDVFQSNIFVSDIGITDVDVGCRISPTLRSVSMCPPMSGVRFSKDNLEIMFADDTDTDTSDVCCWHCLSA
jgi:hypothetical protein